MTAFSPYWLIKSEPSAFSIDDLQQVGLEPWTGVRNYQARNFLRDAMRVGDGILFYHSHCQTPGIVGVAEVASPSYADPTQFDPNSAYYAPTASKAQPRWFAVDVRFQRKLSRCITRPDILGLTTRLGPGFPLTARGNRLSIIPVNAGQWDILLSLE